MSVFTFIKISFENIGILTKTQANRTNFRPIFYILSDDEEIGVATDKVSSAEEIRNYIFKTYQNKLNFQKFELTLDEGGGIFKKMIPGLGQNYANQAIVAVCEKGYLDLEITVNSTGGHSSLAKFEDNAIVRMNKIVRTLTDNSDYITPFYTFAENSVERKAFSQDFLLPEMSFLYKAIFGNIWLTQPIIENVYKNNPTMATTVKTVMAFTILNSGMKSNVQPQNAKLNINFRLHPLDSPEDIYLRVKHVLENFYSSRYSRGIDFYDQISVKNKTSLDNDKFGGKNRCQFENTDFSLKLLERNLKNIYNQKGQGGIVLAPVLCPGATDSRKFVKYSKSTLRMVFNEFADGEALRGMHGNDERVVDTFEKGIRFYLNFLRDAASGADV